MTGAILQAVVQTKQQFLSGNFARSIIEEIILTQQ
jgi:hypothetical protein